MSTRVVIRVREQNKSTSRRRSSFLLSALRMVEPQLLRPFPILLRLSLMFMQLYLVTVYSELQSRIILTLLRSDDDDDVTNVRSLVN